jgi:hypothetical protein
VSRPINYGPTTDRSLISGRTFSRYSNLLEAATMESDPSSIREGELALYRITDVRVY